jgi:hypothetical protein
MDTFSLGAFDGERPDSVDGWADRIFSALQQFRELDEATLANWFAVGTTKAASMARPLGMDRNSLKQAIERGRVLSESGEWITDLGYSLSAWNGREDAPLRLTIHVCRHGYGLPNLFMLDLGAGPAGVGPQAVDPERLKLVVEAVARTIDPSWIVVDFVRPGVRPWMSWYLYLRGDVLAGIELPAVMEPKKVGQHGWMIGLPAPVAATDSIAVAAARDIDELIVAARLQLPNIPRPVRASNRP